MSATTLPTKSTSNGQLFADWVMIVLTLAALVAGWFVMNGVQGRSVSFESAGISAQTPLGWLTSSVKGNEILHVSDPLSSGFSTTYTIQNIPIASGSTVNDVVSQLILDRGQTLDSFRVLDQRPVTVNGQEAYEMDYVFVDSNPDPTHNSLPNVVRGQDFIFLKADHAVVATYWADENSYTSDLGRFQRFLGSLKF